MHGNLCERGLAADTTTGGRVEISLQRGRIEGMSQLHRHDITRATVSPQVVSLNSDDFLLRADESFAIQEANCQLTIVARRSHGDGNTHHCLSRPLYANFQGFFCSEPVLQGAAALVVDRQQLRPHHMPLACTCVLFPL
jgi:hypothetical protein